ncbi:glutamine--fructose-6-phosphate transaminase (isomerizing) [Halobacterium litoreum]|uniref:Glutamine--fructose-6-phosphate aminotransferase [isomerizing] n=1 Tax=Halobacterium litoreum TaxID=2039234 RepID=A0ABD5NBR0_9EURY|nr:glutamine--fructose-6-phosphate transaminase (isomerizing) [Halobacterium litoreum]UHH14398.1 glutamine--fructose-6-phosphate transaminase (isomerizing) [Halobacterium litoreum]
MCGIIGRVGYGDAVDALVTGLENLEYRGYDSAGVAVQNGTGLAVRKQSGDVSDLEATLRHDQPTGNVGVGHTRWSTHGPPTDQNAHPHTSETDEVAVVHNGVIENHAELRDRLEATGCEFTSDTDTEVVPHLLEQHLDGRDADSVSEVADAFRATLRDLEGSFALAVLVDGVDAVFAAREGSPLVLGVGEDAYFLGSDVPAFLDWTDRVMYLEDGDVAVVAPDGLELTDQRGEPVERDVERVEWSSEDAGKGGYDHYMLKEIHSQPDALTDTLSGRVNPGDGGVAFESLPDGAFADVEQVRLVACGTSYHASLAGARLLRQAGIPAHAELASEFSLPESADDTLAVAVTQSGETADTLGAVRAAADAGAQTLAVTNVVGSTAARECDDALFIRAGPEIGVAATKTFTSQVATLSLLSRRIAADVGADAPGDAGILDGLDALPGDVRDVTTGDAARAIANRYRGSDAYFFIGRGAAHSVALEGALKFKEITYEHAEGFAAGELKHGPLALVTPDTPVFAIFTGDGDEQTLTNVEEVQSRGAPVVAVAPDGHPAVDVADDHLPIPDTVPTCASLLAAVQLQLLSYHAAELLDRAIDKPRNLAKSVTVQ